MLRSLFILFVFSPLFLFSQIESGKSGGKKIKNKEVKVKTEEKSEDAILIQLSYLQGNSFRFLQKNGDFYGKELGERVNEFKLNTKNFQLGASSKITKNIALDFGIGFQQYGEKYEQTFSDTVIRYQNTYTNIVIPLKIQFQTGNDFVFFANTGIQAQQLFGYKNKYTTVYKNVETTVTDKTLSDKNSFSIANCLTLGVQLHWSKKTCIIFAGDFIQQITNTYNKQAAYIHKPYYYGYRISIGYKL